MKLLSLAILAAAWAALFLAPKSTPSRLLQLLLFGILGTVLTLAGGFAYWWDAGMRPGQKSAFILVCGLLTLVSQSSTVLRGALDQEGGMPWPRRAGRRR